MIARKRQLQFIENECQRNLHRNHRGLFADFEKSVAGGSVLRFVDESALPPVASFLEVHAFPHSVNKADRSKIRFFISQ
jgi:hypothetical protein